MSEQPIIEVLCAYVDDMCRAAVSEAVGFHSASTIMDMRTEARRNLNKQLRELAERENQLAHSPADPHGHEPTTVDLPLDNGVRRSPNVDAAD